MTHGAENKIDRLIEEANKEVQDAVSKWRGGDVFATIPNPLVSAIGGLHSGYETGKEMGHPWAGAILKQEGAAGAKSKNDPSIGIGDVYGTGNLLKRAAQGGIVGSLAGIPAGPAGIAGGAIGGAAANAGLIPGARYGLGKLFGGKTNEDRVIK